MRKKIPNRVNVLENKNKTEVLKKVSPLRYVRNTYMNGPIVFLLKFVVVSKDSNQRKDFIVQKVPLISSLQVTKL